MSWNIDGWQLTNELLDEPKTIRQLFRHARYLKERTIRYANEMSR